MKTRPRIHELSSSQAISSNSTREKIVDHLRGTEDGTDYFSNIRKKLDLSNGSAGYHLRTLEKIGVLTSEMRDDHKKWYSLKDSSGLEDIESKILSVVNKHEDGLSPAEVARFTQTRYGTVLSHLQILSQDGKIFRDPHNGHYCPVSQPVS